MKIEKIQSVFDPAFAAYGNVVEGHDFTPLLDMLRKNTERPTDKVIYTASDAQMESLDIFKKLQDHVYGGMPVQIGYCNGNNRHLNCLEYHRGCEICVPADDTIFLLAQKHKVKEGKLDTREVEAFMAPAGTAILLYETALHYAPCNGPGQDSFQVIIVLPRDTNTDKPNITPTTFEDKLLWARNKWLIAHPDADAAKNGAFVGLVGDNVHV